MQCSQFTTINFAATLFFEQSYRYENMSKTIIRGVKKKTNSRENWKKKIHQKTQTKEKKPKKFPVRFKVGFKLLNCSNRFSLQLKPNHPGYKRLIFFETLIQSFPFLPHPPSPSSLSLNSLLSSPSLSLIYGLNNKEQKRHASFSSLRTYRLLCCGETERDREANVQWSENKIRAMERGQR